MTRITQNEGSNEEPAFSPNGRAIAFARAGQGIFIANADGTGKAVKVWSGLGDRRRLGTGTQGMKRLALLCFVIACGTDAPPLTHDTSLDCPSPDGLPFRVTSGFRHAQNANLAKMDTRIKHEVADTIGNPSGSVADTHLADTATPGTAVAVDGTMGVTTVSGGLFSMPMTDEYVSAWTYDGSAWQQLGRGLTDADGVYSLPGMLVPNGQPVYSVLEANGTCAAGYDYAFPTGAKVVVTDIDGTLTTNDNELAMEIADPTHDPAMMGHADAMLQAWAMKGYPIVYLTNRPHPLRVETRGWLAEKMMPGGP